MIRAAIAPTFESFRERARALLAAGVAPHDVTWDDGTGQASLFGGCDASTDASATRATAAKPPRVPAAFVAKGALAALHCDADRWDVLYRVVHRLAHGEPELLEVATDPDVARLARLVTDVKHDEHRMHAFLRFRRVAAAGDDEGASDATESFVAWYEPDHDIVGLAAPHFARRYPNMRWVILTPRRTAVWRSG